MEEAVIEIVIPDDGEYDESGLIYAPWLLSQTQEILPRVVPVSYTHLDVYKRQSIDGAGAACAAPFSGREKLWKKSVLIFCS